MPLYATIFPVMDTQSSSRDDARNSVIKNTGLMTLGTLLSRASGLIRTWAMAFALGNSMLTSAYQVANNLPNVVFELVAGGFLSTAFLPVLLLERERFGKEGESKYTSNILNITLILLGALSVLCSIFAEQVVATQTFTQSADSDVYQQTVMFFRIFAFQLVFYGLGGVITGVLNAKRSFLLTSVAPALNNIVVIITFFAYVPLSQVNSTAALIMLGVGATLGVAVQFVIQIPALLKTGYRWRPYINLKDPAIAETIKIAVPSLIYIVANVVAVSFRNAFSLVGADNGPSTLSYAWMWYQLPYGVVAVSLSSTMFTEMSDSVARGDISRFRSQVGQGLRGTLFMIIPLTGLLFVLAQPLISLFHAGAFTGDDVYQVSEILQVWILSLPLYSVGMYLYKAFASLRKLMAFALMNCAIVVLQLILYAVLCQRGVLGLMGVPVADFIYFTVRAVASVVLLNHYVGKDPQNKTVQTTIRTVLATVVGCVPTALLLAFIPTISGIGAMANAIIQLAICGIVGLAVVFGACRLFRVEEFSIVERFMRRLKRR